MQSLLTESFNRNSKPITKIQRQSQQEDDQQQQSKRQEEQQNESDLAEPIIQRKKSQSSQEQQAMKDAFQSDQSYLIVTQDIKDQKLVHQLLNNDSSNGVIKNAIQGAENGQININNIKTKRIIKKKKDFVWKYMWVKQQNAIKNSKPIWLRKWIRVKTIHENNIQQEVNQTDIVEDGKQLIQQTTN